MQNVVLYHTTRQVR